MLILNKQAFIVSYFVHRKPLVNRCEGFKSWKIEAFQCLKTPFNL